MRCPLLNKYKVKDEETASNPNGDWAKNICSRFCPLDECIEENRKRISLKSRLKLKRVNIPIIINKHFYCRRCGGFLSVEKEDLVCVNCGERFNKPNDN